MRLYMKRLLWVIIACHMLLLIISNPTPLWAALITGYFTADNYAYLWDNSKWEGISGASWSEAKRVDLTIDYDDPIVLYFAVKNNRATGSAGNGAGFIGGFYAQEGIFDITGSSKLLTSAYTCQVAEIDYWTGALGVVPNTLSTWVMPTSWGKNGDPATAWYGKNNGPIALVDQDAEWLWFGLNFDADMPAAAVFRMSFTLSKQKGGSVDVVPEPGTFLLFSLTLSSFLLQKRKKACKFF